MTWWPESGPLYRCVAVPSELRPVLPGDPDWRFGAHIAWKSSLFRPSAWQNWPMSKSGSRYPGGGTSGDVQAIDQRSNRELVAGSVIATLSLVVVVGVAFVLLGSATRTGAEPRASILPAVNAVLNGTSALLLTVGYACIRRKRIIAHKTCMATAFVVSSLFLVTYLIHHYRVGSVPFAGEGWLRGVYFSLLIPHVVLAALLVPLALTTIHRGLTSRFDKHVRIARWTLPIWLYVSVSGVLVYWMLYWPR